jgi:prepilin-type N-terminal cleavage/methylation domain-containing protein
MRRYNKNRRGFTLVEMMLSLAIIAIIFGLTTALMVSISDSFTMTYNLNDASDYAVLYGYGIENSVLSQVSKGAASEWYVGTYTPTDGSPSQDSILICKSSGEEAVFLPHQMKTKEVNTGLTVDKWIIKMYFKTESGGLVKYCVLVYDNYCNPTKPLMYKYEGSFWIPHSKANVTVDTGSATNSLCPGYYAKLKYSTS